MFNKPLPNITNFLPKDTLKTAGTFLSKALSIFFIILSVLMFSGTAAFLVAGITTVPIFYSFAVFLFFLGILFTVLARKVKNAFFPDYSKQHYQDIKTCNEILQQVKTHYKNEKINKDEFKHIFQTMQSELKNAHIVARKLDAIITALRSPDFDPKNLTNRINREKNKPEKDDKLLATLKEQLENIEKLDQHREQLKNQISNLRLSFNSIYTKLTLLNTQNRPRFDEIETEIQKMLNFKLDVAKYEEELTGAFSNKA